MWKYIFIIVSNSWSKITPHCNGNSVYIFLFWELRSLSPNFNIHVSVSDLYIPRIGPHISSCRKGRPFMEMYNSLADIWMWKLGLRPRYSFSGNICFKFLAFCHCSAHRWVVRHHGLENYDTVQTSWHTVAAKKLRIRAFQRSWQQCCTANTQCQIFPEKEMRGGNIPINRSQTHECGNRDWDRAIPFLGIHKWDFHCSVVSMNYMEHGTRFTWLE